MKYLLLCSLIFLTGCVTPVKHSFPAPPDLIVEKCKSLDTINPDEERLSEFLKVVTKNYNLYYECAAKHELIVKWLNEQRTIHDAVFNKGK